MWCCEPRLAENGLDTVVRRVLRLAIEQARARQRKSVAGVQLTGSLQIATQRFH
jgi:isocitrate/isopropylmalate dehydrogenase